MKKVIKKWYSTAIFLVLLLSSLPVAAQSNLFIDQIMGAERAPFDKTACLVFQAAGLLPETASPAEAFSLARELGIHVSAPEKPVTVGLCSFLVMKAFHIRGGIFYTLFPSPRYSAREAAFRGFLYGDKSPSRELSGEEVLQIVNRVLTWKEKK